MWPDCCTMLLHDPYHINRIIGERAKRVRHSQVCTIENRGYIMVRAISVYSAGVAYAARFTAAVKIPLPLATFQF